MILRLRTFIEVGCGALLAAVLRRSGALFRLREIDLERRVRFDHDASVGYITEAFSHKESAYGLVGRVDDRSYLFCRFEITRDFRAIQRSKKRVTIAISIVRYRC
jgi:hypothetical protein